MQKRDGRLVYSPSNLITFLESPYASWMDRMRVERPGSLIPGEPPAEMELLARMGIAHEANALASLKSAGKDIWSPLRPETAFEDTAAAMKAGRGVLYQAALRRDSFEGHADFLERIDLPSALGSFSYIVADTKLAKSPKPYFLVQLCAYAKMLEAYQGCIPKSVRVITGDGLEHEFPTIDYWFYFLALERAFLHAQAAFDPDRRPVPEPRADHRRWAEHAEAELERLDHPSRVAGMSAVRVKRLASVGITTMTELARTKLARVPRMDDTAFDRVRRQARLQIESTGLEKPKFEVITPDTSDPRRGLATLPSPSAGDIFFDMEGYPFAEDGLEYLFGATYEQHGKRLFFETWAKDEPSEKRAFEQFVDWATERFAADPAMHIYHYAPYEPTALKKLMGRHGTRENEVDHLLRNEVFVDLYRVVRQSLLIGEPRYSLKNVEHLYRGKREGEVASGGESVVQFARWLEEPDGEDWRTAKILSEIRDYNIEDCDSTLDLRNWLLERQREAKIAFIPAPKLPKKESADDAEVTDEADDELAKALRAAIPADISGDPEHWRIQKLLADLVDFHRRELKPLYWAQFQRRDATHEELFDDADCLGCLTRTGAPVVREKQNAYFEYTFDANQDSKMRAGKVMLSGDLRRVWLESLDAERGIAILRIPFESPPLPRLVSLLPDEIVKPAPIDKAVRSVASAWQATGALAPALDALLRRLPPRSTGKNRITTLNSSSIAIQGPPGSGKTTTAAKAIVELIRRGQRVGVTSNGHKAIEKLMEETLKAADFPIRATKIKSSKDEDIVKSGLADHASSMRGVDLSTDEAPQLVGGTAWAFCNEQAIGAFDYLFIDEASQVSLANVVGMSRSTRNIVLLGDQMQLAQPIKGFHPGESGQSALGYLIGDHRTIPEELGVFLGTSWRMHPNVCRVVSGMVYESRLEAEPSNVRRTVRWKPEAGVVFVPVEHEGNAQESEEEVRAVGELVKDLLERRLVGKDGRERKVTEADILVVAPYNMQVRALRAALPADVRVGTVDKFQGQEAAIAIVSMCASSGETVARGIAFLFSANRLNVAISRAQSLAFVVGSPALARTRVRSVKQMRMVNFFCRLSEPTA